MCMCVRLFLYKVKARAHFFKEKELTQTMWYIYVFFKNKFGTFFFCFNRYIHTFKREESFPPSKMRVCVHAFLCEVKGARNFF